MANECKKLNMRKFKFKAKDIKTGKWVEGDLAYAERRFEREGIRPMIVNHCIHGGIVWVGNRFFVDENTIQLIEEA